MKKVILLFMAVILLLSLISSPGLAAKKFDELILHYAREEFPAAAIGFESFVRKQPEHSKRHIAMYYAAISRMKMNEITKGIKALTKLLSENPENPPHYQVRLAIGDGYLQKRHAKSSLPYLEMAWLSTPDPAQRHYIRQRIEIAKKNIGGISSGDQFVRDVVKVRPATGGIWVVQILSTPDESVAHELRDRLKRDGWPVFLESAIVKDILYTRVRIGTYKFEKEAKEVKKLMYQYYGYEGWTTKRRGED